MTEHPIRSFRKRHDLTLEALAERIGVHKSTILRWETRVVPLPVDRLAAISEVTGIPREELRPDIFLAMSDRTSTITLPRWLAEEKGIV